MISFSSAALLAAAALLGAFGRRFNGGLLGQWAGRRLGSFPGRTAFALMLALPAWLAGAAPSEAALYAAASWIGCAMGMWQGLAMGRVVPMNGPPTSPRAWAIAAALMTAHGLGAVAPAVALAWWMGWSPWPLLAAGLLCAPAYEIAYRWPWHIPVLGCQLQDPPPTAEYLWGALRGVAGVLAVWWAA